MASSLELSLSDVPAIVFAGGLGTRLRSVIGEKPKPLATVAGRPFITFLLDRLVSLGLRRAIICTGYGADVVRTTLGNHYRTMELTYSHESEPRGTGGALALAASNIDAEHALVMNGDSLCSANLLDLWVQHRQKNAMGTILLVRNEDPTRYGTVEIDAEGRVIRFQEKMGSGTAGLINAGVYCLTRRFLESIPTGRQVSLEREIFPMWIGRGLHGWVGDGELLDIGTPDSLAGAEAFLQRLSLTAGHPC